MTMAQSGRRVEEITIAALRAGEIGPADIRIHPDTLEHQAQVAQSHANPQLAANFRRAAELTELSDDRVMAIYEALRPRRSTKAELSVLADGLDDVGAHLNANLIREAADAYEARGLLR